MPLVQLLYGSRSVDKPSSRDLAAILDKARRRNAADDVTGMLCYGEQGFLQLLEGERDIVCETFYRILRDPRHDQVRLLRFVYPEQRRFGGWSMGFAGLGDISQALIERHSADGRYSALAQDADAALNFVYEVAGQVPEHGRDA